MSEFALKYLIDFDNNEGKGFSEEEIKDILKKDERWAFADSIMVLHILKPKNGSFGIFMNSADGQNENKPISNLEIFKIWAMLSNTLSKEAPHEWQRYIAKEAFDKVRQIIAVGKKGIETEDLK